MFVPCTTGLSEESRCRGRSLILVVKKSLKGVKSQRLPGCRTCERRNRQVVSYTLSSENAVMPVLRSRARAKRVARDSVSVLHGACRAVRARGQLWEGGWGDELGDAYKPTAPGSTMLKAKVVHAQAMPC